MRNNSPLDSFHLTFEKPPLFKEKRYRGPLPRPPITAHIETGLRWVLKHPLYTASVLVFTLIAPLTRTYALEPVRPVLAPVRGPQTVLMLPPLVDNTPPQAQELEQVYIPPPTPPPAPAPVVVSGCGDNFYANYIYMHESGCSTTITNSIGCLGIGQACPASKLLVVCPTMDYACENQFFTNYAYAAYGGWYQSYQFWLQHSWW